LDFLALFGEQKAKIKTKTKTKQKQKQNQNNKTEQNKATNFKINKTTR